MNNAPMSAEQTLNKKRRRRPESERPSSFSSSSSCLCSSIFSVEEATQVNRRLESATIGGMEKGWEKDSSWENLLTYKRSKRVVIGILY